jgi:TRAP-type C4-dicarboxylate transport system substrate-binding protein
VIVGGAGAALAGPPRKTGSVTTLNLAATESRGRPSTEIAEAFAARVKTLSKGAIIVEIAYDSGRTQGGETPLGVQESNLVALVRDGKAQLAIVPTRAFDFQGITSFQALQAPFLTTTETGMNRATTGTVARQLQSGLPKLGLTGLGLVPEGLRRPFGFKHALVAPADFAGIRFIASRSKTLLPLLRLLGATPVNLNGDAMNRAVAKGTVAGGDSTLALAANAALPQPAFTAGNLAFFPKVDAIVGNASADGGAADGVAAGGCVCPPVGNEPLDRGQRASRVLQRRRHHRDRAGVGDCRAARQGGTVARAPAL